MLVLQQAVPEGMTFLDILLGLGVGVAVLGASLLAGKAFDAAMRWGEPDREE